jgi:7,8-dihydropterin-6-yl-methyl-4-(beta-D-ribofuranosyl)aminobenzene 5'-phosphate synthase
MAAIDPDYVIPTHCTGRNAVMAFEKAMPGKVLINMAGTRLVFSA